LKAGASSANARLRWHSHLTGKPDGAGTGRGGMEIIKKSGRFIDWLIRSEIVWRILVAVVVGKVLQILLATKISEQYRTATWLRASGGILFLLIQLGRWWDGKRRLVVQTTAATGPFVSAYVEEHRKNMGPAMLEETEDNMRKNQYVTWFR